MDKRQLPSKPSDEYFQQSYHFIPPAHLVLRRLWPNRDAP